jgi:hypothetical protein
MPTTERQRQDAPGRAPDVNRGSEARTDYARYKAPTANDTALVAPDWPELLTRLRQPRKVEPIAIGGVPLAELAADARKHLVDAAARYTGVYADVATPSAGPIVLSGHQPELFHPGVWFKNFALDTLAKATGGVGVHLIIDSDLCRSASILAPVGTLTTPRREPIAYDQRTAAIPYEQRRLVDPAAFVSFPTRVREAMAPFVAEPLVRDLWKHATAVGCDCLAPLLSTPRHKVERGWGSQTLELPFSEVADSEGFRRLVAEMLLRAEQTAAAYNAALADYRLAHGVKNAAQPLPDLHRKDGWVEAPLWVWSDAAPTRRAIYSRPIGTTIRLTDREGWEVTLPDDADSVVQALAELRQRGVKVRSRALVTTLYGRLVLADLFLHGIGGAKYDQVTDRFAERLLGVRPTEHATMTATLRLPIKHDAPTEANRHELLQTLRDLQYHPERFAPDSEAAAEKQRWVNTPKTPTNAAERHAAITNANRTMAAWLADRRREVEEQLASTAENLRAASVLDNREHAFCLFPADNIRKRLSKLATL